MPQKDRYHDIVVRALEKDGWRIEDQQVMLGDKRRRVYLDILARRNSVNVIFVEVKVFEKLTSPMTYLANVIGQYVTYKGILDYLNVTIPLYLAVPSDAYENFLSESLIQHILKYADVALLIYDVEKEEIVQWKI